MSQDAKTELRQGRGMPKRGNENQQDPSALAPEEQRRTPARSELEAAVEKFASSEEGQERVERSSRRKSSPGDDSHKPAWSEEHGEVREYINLFKAFYPEPDDPNYQLNKQRARECRQKVLELSPEQIKAVAQYSHYDENYTILHSAAREGDAEIVSLLLKNSDVALVDKLDDARQDEPDRFSPLTYAVDSCDQETIELLLEYSTHPADALCAAIQLYEESKDKGNEHDKLVRQQLLEWLLTLPKIVGVKGDPKNVCCINTPAQFIPLLKGKSPQTALQCLCINRDRVYFEKLANLWARQRAEGDTLKTQTQNAETFLYLAVDDADPTKIEHLDFINYLMDNFSREIDVVSKSKRSVLSLACQQNALAIIDILADQESNSPLRKPARIILAQVAPDNLRMLSPLHEAIDDSAVEVVEKLLEKFPGDVNEFLNNPQQLKSIGVLALEAWRKNMLDNQDTTEQISVIRKLLAFDTEGRLINQQFQEAEHALAAIGDDNIKTSLSKLLSKVKSDYSLIGYNTDKGAIEQKIKAFCLASTVHHAAVSFSGNSELKSSATEKARKGFLICAKALLYSNSIKTLVGVAVCAFLGMVVGGIVGFIVGELISGGAGGGVALGPPSAQYGWAVGMILGCFIFGTAAGTSRYMFSDLFKSAVSLWSISKAMQKSIQPEKSAASLETVPLLQLQDTKQQKTAANLGGDHMDDSFGGGDKRLVKNGF